MKSELIMAVNQLCVEKDLPREVIMDAIEDALLHAYRRNFANNNAMVRVTIDPDSGDLAVFCEKTVVEIVEDDVIEITLEDAQKLDPLVELGGIVLIEKEPTNFGRIAAQTAKQVILQRIHEAERDAVYDSFHEREGELITGTVQSIDYRSDQITISLGKKAEGLLAREDQLPTDRYRIGMTVRSLLVEVHKGTRGPQIRLSRTHRNMLRRLLEREVPEIFNGTVEIRSIAREPGQRSKVAVSAAQSGVDPVGSCVGMRGTRIQNIVDELGGEKIDVVEWSADTRQFISNALSPAKPTDALLIEEGDARTAIVIVPDRQLSLAIGKEGQNARLAAKLTGWRIDIKSELEAATEGLDEIRRQQTQLMKTRSLEAKMPSAPTDDLLSRAEWLLRERDKAAVTLDHAAQMLAGVGDSPAPKIADLPTLVEEEPRAPIELPQVEPVESVELPDSAEPAEPTPANALVFEPEVLESEESTTAPIDAGVEPVFDEDDEDQESSKGQAKKKKTAKKRQLVFDETLGEVVSRRKRKPGRSDWGDDVDY